MRNRRVRDGRRRHHSRHMHEDGRQRGPTARAIYGDRVAYIRRVSVEEAPRLRPLPEPGSEPVTLGDFALI